MSAQEYVVWLLAGVLISESVEVGFALDRDSFKFGEAPLGEGDKERIAIENGNGRIIAYKSDGAFLSSLQDGAEYGDVGQVRIYDRKTQKLYAIYSDDIERIPGESIRGIEVRYGKIKYIGTSKVQFEAFLETQARWLWPS